MPPFKLPTLPNIDPGVLLLITVAGAVAGALAGIISYVGQKFAEKEGPGLPKPQVPTTPQPT